MRHAFYTYRNVIYNLHINLKIIVKSFVGSWTYILIIESKVRKYGTNLLQKISWTIMPWMWSFSTMGYMVKFQTKDFFFLISKFYWMKKKKKNKTKTKKQKQKNKTKQNKQTKRRCLQVHSLCTRGAS